MNRFLLPDNELNVHVRLSPTRQDSLLTQQGDIDFSDCACSPSPSNYTGNNRMDDLQFVNREDELTEIKKRTATRKIIDAPAGYGKSQLLRKLQEEYRKDDKQCACVDFNITSGDLSIRTQIADQLNILHNSRNISITQLLRSINRLGGDIVLFFDSVEKASESDLEWLLERFIPECEGQLRNINFLAIFAGRNMDSGDYDRRKRWKSKNFESIKLSELSLPVIDKVIRNTLGAIDNGFSHEMYKDWAERILKLSGGHPRSIRNLIMEELLPNKGFLPTSREDEIELFTKHVEPQIKEVIDKETLGEDLYQALDLILVFRSFNTEHFSFLQTKGKIPQLLDPLDTLQKLAERGLIALNGDSELYSDAIVRNLIVTRWRLLHPKDYIEFNELAYKFYSDALNALRSSARQLPPSTLKAEVRRTIKEGFYHFCQVSFANQNANSSSSKALISELRHYVTFLENIQVNLGRYSFEAYLRDILERDQENLTVLELKGVTLDELFEALSMPTQSNHGENAPSKETINVQEPVNEKINLREKIVKRHNLDELRTLCEDINVNFENLGGVGLEGKARELISYLERNNRLSDLKNKLGL